MTTAKHPATYYHRSCPDARGQVYVHIPVRSWDGERWNDETDCCVDEDGDVYVWYVPAGHYIRDHGLTDAEAELARAMAGRARANPTLEVLDLIDGEWTLSHVTDAREARAANPDDEEVLEAIGRLERGESQSELCGFYTLRVAREEVQS